MDRNDAAEPTDTVLLSRIAAGERVAMRAFYERHHAAAFRFARARLNGDDDAAADAVHDAMLEVWRRAEAFSGRSNARTWLLAIVRNKAIDRLRRESREVPSEPDTERPDEADDPETIIANAQNAERVRLCLRALGAEHRTVIHLAFFEEMAHAEIAAVTGVPPGTVKSRVHHAKRLLAHCLGRK